MGVLRSTESEIHGWHQLRADIQAVSLLLVATFGFALLAYSVGTQSAILRLDHHIEGWLQLHRQMPLERVALMLSQVHGATVLTLVTICVVLLTWTMRDRSEAIAFAAGMLGTALLIPSLKMIFARVRPAESIHLVDAPGYSFPSGHAMGSTVFYTLLTWLLWRRCRSPRQRAWLCVAAVTTTFLTCASRVYLGVHYLSDVLAGVCAGVIWLSLVFLLSDRWQQMLACQSHPTIR